MPEVDPGNYSTDVAAGASYRFRLLFIVLISNLFAIFLQSLAIKLGTVSGLNLAEACRAFLPRWLNYILYVFAEAAIIATDIAEVCGSEPLHAFLIFPKGSGRDTELTDPGDWFCHCVEPLDPSDTTGRWMCYFDLGCLGHPLFLQAIRIHESP